MQLKSGLDCMAAASVDQRVVELGYSGRKVLRIHDRTQICERSLLTNRATRTTVEAKLWQSRDPCRVPVKNANGVRQVSD